MKQPRVTSPSGRLPVSSREARRILHRCTLDFFVLTRRNASWECTAASSIRQVALIFDKPSLSQRGSLVFSSNNAYFRIRWTMPFATYEPQLDDLALRPMMSAYKSAMK